VEVIYKQLDAVWPVENVYHAVTRTFLETGDVGGKVRLPNTTERESNKTKRTAILNDNGTRARIFSRTNFRVRRANEQISRAPRVFIVIVDERNARIVHMSGPASVALALYRRTRLGAVDISIVPTELSVSEFAIVVPRDSVFGQNYTGPTAF